MTRIGTAVAIAIYSLIAVVATQERIAPPPLTDLQKLQLLNLSKDVELWELRTQTAAASLERARAAFQKLVTDLTPAGYRMTEKMEFVPVPPPTSNNEPQKPDTGRR